MRLSDKERRRANEISKRHDSSRGGSAKTFDRRVSPVSSIDEDQHKTNQVSSRALASGTTDPNRAVAPEHQKDNSTNARVLASGGPDESRAVGADHIKRLVIGEEHQKSNSTDSRVLGSGTLDENRAVGTLHIKRLAVDSEHQKDNSTGSRILASHPSDDSQRSVGADHIKSGSIPPAKIDASDTNPIPASKLPTLGGMRGVLDGGRLQKGSVPSDRLSGVHGGKLFGKNSIPWGLVDVSGVVFTPRLSSEIADLKRYVDRNFAKRNHSHGP